MDWFLYDNGLRHEKVKDRNGKYCLSFQETLRRCRTSTWFLEVIKWLFIMPVIITNFTFYILFEWEPTLLLKIYTNFSNY